MTYSGEGRSKKQAKLVAAKNALSTFLDPQIPMVVSSPFPTIEFNQGAAVVDVDFTSDDPADANFIINTMNRIQAGPNLFEVPALPLSTRNGQCAPPANGKKPPVASSKSGNEDTAVVDNDDDIEKEEEEEEATTTSSSEGDDVHYTVQDLDNEFSFVAMDEEEESASNSGDEQELDLNLYPEILEIIRISVEHYIDYDTEIQSKYLVVWFAGPVEEEERGRECFPS